MRCFLTVLLTFFAMQAFAAPAQKSALPPELASHAGQPVYVDFWASWCLPCAQSIPWLNRMNARYGEHMHFVGVNVDVRRRDADRFLSRHPINFDVVFDPEGSLPQTYAIKGMPTAVLLDASGRVIWQHSGFRESEIEQYEHAIQEALK